MSLETTSPTRMNLLARRSQIKLAADGAQLLHGKRDALLKELLARARELLALRRELERRGRIASTALAFARAVESTPAVRSASLAGRRPLRVSLTTEMVWGLPLVDAEQKGVLREPDERNLGEFNTSAHLLESMSSAESMLEQLIMCAPAEANLRLLSDEIKKVSRRIHALEEQLLPRLREDVRIISRVLEERQREEVFRMKRYKRKSAERND